MKLAKPTVKECVDAVFELTFMIILSPCLLAFGIFVGFGWLLVQAGNLGEAARVAYKKAGSK